MIHKKYDKSLSLILCNNGINRSMIESFINSVPSRLYDKMYKSILYSFNAFSNFEYSNVSKYDEILLSGEYKTSGDMLYWYMINPQTQALNLGECVCDGDEVYDTFQMTLYPIDDFEIFHIKNFDKLLLGEFSYGYIPLEADEDILSKDCITSEFNLIKYPVVDYVICSSSDMERKKHYDLVNIANHLDIQNTMMANKYARRRKKF